MNQRLRLTKEDALLKITSCIERINAVKSRFSDSGFFEKWKRDTLIIIQYVFGKSEQHVKDYQKIKYSPEVYHTDVPERALRETFESGLERARGVLSSMKKEIEDWWRDDKEEEGNPFDPWGPVSSIFFELQSSDLVLQILAEAGFIPDQNLSRSEIYSHSTRIRAYQLRTTNFYSQLNEGDRKRFILNIARALAKKKSDVIESLNESLKRIDWYLINDNLIPLSLFDPNDLDVLPAIAKTDLVKAATRLLTDPAGAISAACGAVNSVAAQIYEKHSYKKPDQDSFQEKVTRAFKLEKVFEKLEKQLIDLNWEENKAKEFSGNLRGAINQAAKVMETLRSQMGDVHGTKPVFEPLVYDSLKWAMIICSLLK